MAEKVVVNTRKPEAKNETSVSRTRKTDLYQSMNSPADHILFLQRTAGNQAVQQLIKSGALQAKLTVGQPNDKYEQKADRVADAVLRMPEPGVQRQEEEEEILQTKPLVDQITPLVQRQVEEEEEEEMLQAKSREDSSSEVTNDFESQINAIKSGGRPLAESDRDYFEPRFGVDFSQVRLHSDTQAAETARAVNARAFTVGQDVVFGEGQYEPGTSTGKMLLGHELTHGVQQSTLQYNRTLQCQNAGLTQASASSALCDGTHTTAINTALSESRNWRRDVSRWFETHLNNIRRSAPSTVGRYNRVVLTVLRELRLLDRHFKISNEIRRRGSIFPMSTDERGDISDFENFGNASYDIRRRFSEVELSALNFQCQIPSPSGRRGADVLGSAIPGSQEFTIYTNGFDRQHPEGQAGVVLHEAFHATFSNFNHDSYSSESSYPGSSPLTNADSFANFASIIANGRTYRIIIPPVIRITGTPH